MDAIRKKVATFVANFKKQDDYEKIVMDARFGCLLPARRGADEQDNGRKDDGGEENDGGETECDEAGNDIEADDYDQANNCQADHSDASKVGQDGFQGEKNGGHAGTKGKCCIATVDALSLQRSPALYAQQTGRALHRQFVLYRHQHGVA